MVKKRPIPEKKKDMIYWSPGMLQKIEVYGPLLLILQYNSLVGIISRKSHPLPVAVGPSGVDLP